MFNSYSPSCATDFTYLFSTDLTRSKRFDKPRQFWRFVRATLQEFRVECFSLIFDKLGFLDLQLIFNPKFGYTTEGSRYVFDVMQLF